MTEGYVSEVFDSVQGEGAFIGYRQVFVRMSGCVFGCPYCDTDYERKAFFMVGSATVDNPVSAESLAEALLKEYGNESFHSFSFTGGEPLLVPDFIEKCAVLLKRESRALLFLETSGMTPRLLPRFDGIFDIMSVDVKTHDRTALKNIPFLFETVKELKASRCYLKFLYSQDMPEDRVGAVAAAAERIGIKEIIIQPVDNKITENEVKRVFKTFYNHGVEPRLIPQTHKFIGLP